MGRKYQINKEILIEELTNYINKNGYPNSLKKCFNSKNGLHSINSYKTYLGDNIADWIEQCGFTLTEQEKYNILNRGKSKEITKDELIKVILKMQSKLNRPLMYDDFRNPNFNEIGIHMVRKYWNSMNNMKLELGLEIIQDSMIDKQLSKEEIVKQIQDVCNKAILEGRDFITTREFNSNDKTLDYTTIRKMIRRYFNMSFSDYITSIGFRTGKQGKGILFKFDDEEVTTSQFEYMFSKFLKDNGLKYNIDYYRDVRYDSFISNYNGNMNCDYIIHYKNKIIYVEIAGIINDYKKWYYEDKIIDKSKSKELYRLKLKQKEDMFKNNNLIYFILFPCDLTKENFSNMLNNPSLDLKHDIEGFMKNNIDWVKIQKIGELKYKDNELTTYNQKIVNYKESEVLNG